MKLNSIKINGENLRIEDIILAARGHVNSGGNKKYPLIAIEENAYENLKKFRTALEKCIKEKVIMYGVNTGCGSAKGTAISNEEINSYQKHYIPAHCCGVGTPFSEEIVRTAILLRANSLAKGNSGVRPILIERLLALYNKNVIPYIPEKGSVGSSGDLIPLAHLSAVLIGDPKQKAYYEGTLMSAPEALKTAGIEPLVLAAKEAMALTNGSTFILAILTLGLHDAKNLLDYSHIATALSFEAIGGEKNALDIRLHVARNDNYALKVAETILRFTKGSKRTTNAGRLARGIENPRVQDAYSFRAYPTVAGSVLKSLGYVEEVVIAEINASTDNPLLFQRSDGTFDVISGGNFHGENLAQASDFLKITCQQLAGISERRFYALTMPRTSYGLPADLSGQKNADLNTGFMILQYTAAALVADNKILCHPSVTDSIPTSADQEDYVSMGTNSARHLLIVLENTYAVIASEILASCQGIDLITEKLKKKGCEKLGELTSLFHKIVREKVSTMEDDRHINYDLDEIITLLRSEKLLEK